MSDDTAAEIQSETQPEAGAGTPEAEPFTEAPSSPVGPTTAEAWAQVVNKLSELSDAIAAWAKAAADTPENRRHVDDVRAGVNDMARQANEAFASVSVG